MSYGKWRHSMCVACFHKRWPRHLEVNGHEMKFRLAGILALVLLSSACSNPSKGIAESKAESRQHCLALANATGKLDYRIEYTYTPNFALYRNVCMVMMTWLLPDGETNRTCSWQLGSQGDCGN